jgi:hypothetical protein
MRGISLGKSREIEDPYALRKILEKEEPKTWQKGVEKLKPKAEEMYRNHELYEYIKRHLTDWKKEYRRVEDIPQEVYEKVSDEKGYQAELIAALTLKIHEKDMEAKRDLH